MKRVDWTEKNDEKRASTTAERSSLQPYAQMLQTYCPTARTLRTVLVMLQADRTARRVKLDAT